ncbi:DinB family protein [Flavobacterium sp.]|uniref:DinB family protein n=1 Tax=Flavobacterium sp. TaxID=239 RepID=UPI004048E7BF
MIQFNQNEFAPFYANYVNKSMFVKNIVEGLKAQEEEIVSFFKNIPENKHEFRYATGKWTIKDILLHLIDVERIFAYRALRISRNDTTLIPGFDENEYVDNANATTRSLENLIEEYILVRKATIALFSSFTEEQYMRIGNASNNSVSVRGLGYIILGHEKHHILVIQERYL